MLPSDHDIHMNFDDFLYYLQENQTLQLTPKVQDASDFALFDALYGKKCDNDCISLKENGYLEISNLKQGKYVLTSLNNKPITSFLVLPSSNIPIDEEIKHDESDNDLTLAIPDNFYVKLSPKQLLTISCIVKFYNVSQMQ